MAGVILIILLVMVYLLIDFLLYFFTSNLGIFKGVGPIMKVLYFIFCPIFLIIALIASMFQVKKDKKEAAANVSEETTTSTITTDEGEGAPIPPEAVPEGMAPFMGMMGAMMGGQPPIVENEVNDNTVVEAEGVVSEDNK